MTDINPYTTVYAVVERTLYDAAPPPAGMHSPFDTPLTKALQYLVQEAQKAGEKTGPVPAHCTREAYFQRLAKVADHIPDGWIPVLDGEFREGCMEYTEIFSPPPGMETWPTAGPGARWRPYLPSLDDVNRYVAFGATVVIEPR